MPAAKKINKSTKAAATKKVAKKGKKNFSSFIAKVLKQAAAKNQKLSMSSKSMAIVNSFVFDMFDRIATEAAAITRTNKKSTLGSKEIQTAVRIVLPAGIAKHAAAESVKAVTKLSA